MILPHNFVRVNTLKELLCVNHTRRGYLRNRTNLKTERRSVEPSSSTEVSQTRSLHAHRTAMPFLWSLPATANESDISPCTRTASALRSRIRAQYSSASAETAAVSTPAGTSGNGTSTISPNFIAAAVCSADHLTDG